jgi:hypothetical protein
LGHEFVSAAFASVLPGAFALTSSNHIAQWTEEIVTLL